jgi:hypothetical protein
MKSSGMAPILELRRAFASSGRYRDAVRLLLTLAGFVCLLCASALPAAVSSRKATGTARFQLGRLTENSSFKDGSLRTSTPLKTLRSGSWGGEITAADGEKVTVLVSDAYPVDPAIPQETADLLTQLYHGSELSLVSIYIAPLAEVQKLCGLGAGGCFAGNQIVSTGDPLPDGTSAANVLVHEYGHHVAANRTNTPWDGLDWGPKRWDTAANICTRVEQGTAFPGDEATNYELNPGEAWAETYRVLNYQKQAWANWILTDWRIVDRSFYPGAAELAAAKADVLQPWPGPRRTTWGARLRRVAPKGKPITVARRRRALVTPLDGEVEVTMLHAPAGTTMSLTTPAGKVIAGPAHYALRTTVCARRKVLLVVRGKRPGSFVVSARTP